MTISEQRRILLYGDVNLNIMDGSAVWLASMAEAIAGTNSHVDVQLKAKVHDPRLLERLNNLPNIRLVSPPQSGDEDPSLTPRQAARQLAALDEIQEYDAVMVRGLAVCHAVSISKSLNPKSWLYITDIPFPPNRIDSRRLAQLQAVCANATRLFTQTENSRSYLEALIPAAAGKVLLLPPMVPDDFFVEDNTTAGEQSAEGADHVELVYSGKFAKNWRTLEMMDLPSALADVGIDAKVTYIGDKFQDDRDDPTWPTRMRREAERPNSGWIGALPRDRAMQIVSRGDFGLGWRSSALDSSLEISTKALEYAAAGVPPIINRTAHHEELFGQDYPLLVDDSLDSVVEAIRRSVGRRSELKQRVQSIARPYSLEAASARLEEYLSRAINNRPLKFNRHRRLRVVVAGHDLKFAGELISTLESSSSTLLRIDHWNSLHTHNEKASQEALDWADVVICEWAGPNAVWYSKHLREGQRLIVRLHAFELRGPWLPNIDTTKIDALVCVSNQYRSLAADKMDLPMDKVAVIGNAVDCADFDRPKLDGFNKRIGMVGFVPFIKRPDRAISVLHSLLDYDPEFSLHIRGRMPWEYSYEWEKGAQRMAYETMFRELGGSPKVRERVVFEPFGGDMASWFRKIGFILSPSTRESFHVAVAEGMAGRTIPLIWDRDGARDVFGDENVFVSEDDIVSHILRCSSASGLMARKLEDSREFAERYDVELIGDAWFGLIEKAINKTL